VDATLIHAPGMSGTCVPGDQAAVWIHQDPLPRADEECRPGEHMLMGLANLYLLRRRLLTA